MADEAFEEEDEGTDPPVEDDTVGDIPLGVDDRNQPFKDVVGQQATGQVDLSVDSDSGFESSLGEGTRTWTDMEAGEDEFIDDTDRTIDDVSLTAEQVEGDRPWWWDVAGAAQQMDPVTGEMIMWPPSGGDRDVSPQTTAPTQPATSKVNPEDVVKTAESMTDADAIEGTLSTDAQIKEIDVTDTRTKEQLLADGALSATITEELAQKATTQYQLDSIMNTLDGSAEMPAWATANMRRVKSIMNQRGLSNSSMAAGAMVQALMESALPIADSDANKYATIQLKNLDNKQQTALRNAALVSARDMKNLDNRMAAAKSNADAFLAMDIQNLKNEQVAANLTYQADTQALFNDQAAANAALNLNAKSENDMNMYYDNLKATVDTTNANREAAMDQFNVDQENSMTKFEAKLNDSRDKFNANMSLLIDQSNTLWRRNINTVNNQGENAANQANAAAFLGITLAAQNQLWQQYRDEANMAFTSGENDESRALQLALTSIANQFAADMFDKELDFEDNKASGALLADVINSILTIGESYLSKSTAGGGK